MRQNKKNAASSQIASQPANTLLPDICVAPIIDPRPNSPSSRSTESKTYLDELATPVDPSAIRDDFIALSCVAVNILGSSKCSAPTDHPQPAETHSNNMRHVKLFGRINVT
jgi:hypothetical protein